MSSQQGSRRVLCSRPTVADCAADEERMSTRFSGRFCIYPCHLFIPLRGLKRLDDADQSIDHAVRAGRNCLDANLHQRSEH